MKRKIIISDPSLRDGNHAVSHKIPRDSIVRYCKFAEAAGIPIIEVGHGNGLGASSILIGESLLTDREQLTTAKDNLVNTKLSIHIIPGLATIKKDILMAMEVGVDIFRVACHCTEATITKTHIEFLKSRGKTVYGTLMMSALVDANTLVEQASKMKEYGADGIIIMDSTGTYMPKDATEKVTRLKELGILVGFHAHNNLAMSVASSLAAAEAGADIIDACIRGFGAGAGNTPLEIIIPVLEKNGFETGIDFKMVIKEADAVMDYLVKTQPIPAPINVLTGLNRLFSGFEKPIIKAAKLFDVEYSSLIFELGNRKLVAGQEDLIIETAKRLQENGK